MEMKRSLAGDLMMLAATMIFGAMTIFSKQILAELEVFNMVALRFLIAFVVCFVIFRKRYRAVDRELTFHALVIGTFLFLAYLCMTVGCKYTTASNAGFMMSLVAFFTPLIVWVQEKKAPSGRQTVSIFITLIGVGLMCLSGTLLLNKGDLVCIGSAFFYAFQMLYTERYAEKHDPVVLGTFQLIFVAVFGFIFSMILENDFRLPVSAAGWGQLLLHTADDCGETQLSGTYYYNLCIPAGIRGCLFLSDAGRADHAEADSRNNNSIYRSANNNQLSCAKGLTACSFTSGDFIQ